MPAAVGAYRDVADRAALRSGRGGSALIRRLVLVAFFIEVGLLLLVLPWSNFWERNYFIQAVPALGAILTNHFGRGAISGLGIVNLFAGFAEMAPIFTARARRDVPFSDEADTQVRP
jgi:polyferredoxin